ncbi:MAG: helix-turn-helix domain-containing protein, partial [Solirubrobacteraceae bacterium]
EIGAQVPDYSRPLEGPFGVTLRYGVERALRRFVETIEHPGGVSAGDRRTYIELGRGEMRQGRTLNALLAAYRVGAQVAWRRFVEAGVRAELEPATLYRVGEAIFAYIDEISGESIEGYAAEQSAVAGEGQQRRAQLVHLLASDPPASPDALRAAAEHASWTAPASVAALVVEGVAAERLASRLGAGTLATTLEAATVAVAEDGAPARQVLAFVCDPDGPGRRAMIEQAVGSRRAALGPSVAITDSARSVARARRALELRDAGVLQADGLIVVEEQATALLLHADSRLAQELAASRLAPLDALRPAARGRLAATLRQWLDHQGRIEETARALAVHPQTVRYRLAQLREAFGPALDDPAARFELSLALRVRGP